jgi:hypothetical protein
MAQPHLILFVDDNFAGLHTHIFESTPDLAKVPFGGLQTNVVGIWADKASSFVILSGQWQFFKDNNFGPAPLPSHGLGPGLYRNVEALGIDNDSISSVKVIG